MVGKFSMEGEEWNLISKEAKDLVTKMLSYDSRRRLTSRAVLNH
jgi:calcium-dependent protein kinase